MSIITDLGTCVTAAGVSAAFVQLRLNQRQARTGFEDQLASGYRQLIAELPVDAMLDKKLTPSEDRDALSVFYRYFDLCNEQVFLHASGRVSDATWAEWRQGIETNPTRPAFRAAWCTLSAAILGDFRQFREKFKAELLMVGWDRT
jgi:hypothetical protein